MQAWCISSVKSQLIQLYFLRILGLLRRYPDVFTLAENTSFCPVTSAIFSFIPSAWILLVCPWNVVLLCLFVIAFTIYALAAYSYLVVYLSSSVPFLLPWHIFSCFWGKFPIDNTPHLSINAALTVNICTAVVSRAMLYKEYRILTSFLMFFPSINVQNLVRSIKKVHCNCILV